MKYWITWWWLYLCFCHNDCCSI